jgi:hypothetical protein
VKVAVPVYPLATFPNASKTVTIMFPANPAVVGFGNPFTKNVAAPAGRMSNALLVAEVKPPEVAINVYPVCTLFRERPENVATPVTAATEADPLRVLEPGLLAKAKETLIV